MYASCSTAARSGSAAWRSWACLQEGLFIGGDSNLVEGVDIHGCHLSGLQIYSPYSAFPYGAKGSYNIVRDSVFHDNSDVGDTGSMFANGGNADGMSISSGEANQIQNCEAYGNSDDGFDTWRSTDSTVFNSLSHDNGLGDGDGNGFKAGGAAPSSGTSVLHSMAWHNRQTGFDYNTGAKVTFDHDTTWANGVDGFVTGSDTLTRGSIATDNGTADVTASGTQQDDSWQRTGTVTFVSTDPTSPDFLMPTPGGPFEDLGAYGWP